MQKAKFWLPLPQILSPLGRLSRLQYFVYGLIFLAIFLGVFVALALGGVFEIDANGHLAKKSIVSVATYCGLQLTLLWCLFALDVKRLHDLNWPGAIAILVLIDLPVDLFIEIARNYMILPPVTEQVQKIADIIGKIAALGIGLFLTFGPGNKGQNKYGPDPLRPPAPHLDVF